MAYPRARTLAGTGGGGGAFVGELYVDNLNFRSRLTNAIVKVKGHTGFRSIEYFAKGEIGRLDDYFGAWAERGANFNRDFCIWDNTGFNLARHPNRQDVFEGYLNYRKRWGYEHVTLFCNQRPNGPNRLTEHEQDVYVAWMTAAAERVGNCIFEIENETLDGDNAGSGDFCKRFRNEQFGRIPTTNSTWDTAGNGDPEEMGKWRQWAAFHASRDVPEFAWETGKVGFEAQKGGLGNFQPARRPAVDTEGIRIAEGTRPQDHADKMALGLILCAGGHVHGGFRTIDPRHETDLQNCVFPRPGEPGYDHIEAIRKVWNSPLMIDEAAADGHFVRAAVHGHFPFEQSDVECPIRHWDRFIDGGGHHFEDERGAGRTYFMVMPDGRAIGVAAARGNQHKVEVRGELGYQPIFVTDGTVVVVKR